MMYRVTLVGLRPAALVVAMALPLGLGVGGQGAAVHGPRVAQAAACDALGAYWVGPRIMPVNTGTQRHAGPSLSSSGRTQGPQMGFVRPGMLYGSITVASYSGCGGSTAGSFSVSRIVLEPLVRDSTAGTRGLQWAGAYPQALTQSWSVSGTFDEGAAPAAGATAGSVAVRAKITIGKPGERTATSTSIDVTGRLQADPEGRSVRLSFLLPGASTATTLYGWRGGRPVWRTT